MRQATAPMMRPATAPMMRPGALRAGAAEYIDGLLGAFLVDPPRIWAGGPYSGRFGGTNGYPQFHRLSALDELSWRTRIEGSQGIAEPRIQRSCRRAPAGLPGRVGAARRRLHDVRTRGARQSTPCGPQVHTHRLRPCLRGHLRCARVRREQRPQRLGPRSTSPVTFNHVGGRTKKLPAHDGRRGHRRVGTLRGDSRRGSHRSRLVCGDHGERPEPPDRSARSPQSPHRLFQRRDQVCQQTLPRTGPPHRAEDIPYRNRRG